MEKVDDGDGDDDVGDFEDYCYPYTHSQRVGIRQFRVRALESSCLGSVPALSLLSSVT